MKKCMHCDKENREGWFYCKYCGKKASESKFTTNLWMTSDLGKRTDVELSTQSMGDNIQKMRKNLGYAS
jgi:uncharacterized membrane protein YvbJ|tara:strand:- start:1267 stop:1473 length:207 start_codon:yes stop_codon:yes gene_type:complete